MYGGQASKYDTVSGQPPTLPWWSNTLPRTAFGESFRNIDWASSPLGPLDEWGPLLRFATNMVFADSRPACVYWGSELIAVYNEKWIDVAAGAHPRLMGNSFWIGFPDAWADMKPLFAAAMNEGVAVEFPRMELSIVRSQGFTEEVYFMGQLMPVRGASSRSEGVYNTGFENTQQVLYERRRNLLNSLSALPDTRLSLLFPRMTEVLETNARDISMVLIYSMDEDSTTGKIHVNLRTSLGVPEGHPARSEGILGEITAGFLPFFEEVRDTGKPILLLEKDKSIAQRAGHLLEGIEWRGWGEKCRDLSILPLLHSVQLIGFMVIATNPRRDYDEDSAQFVHDLTQQIVVKWGSAVATENALKREETLAEKLRMTEERIRHMAQYAPVGMIHLSVEGEILWANEQWYQITSHPRDVQTSHSWIDCYVESSREQALQEWSNVLEGRNTSTELKLHRAFQPPVPDDIQHNVWVNALGFPLFEDSKVKYVMGTLTDVSHLKWAESVQTRSALLADEAKRRQEEFIDITSHEMRNPLSAIYQCASMISTSLDAAIHTETDLLIALKNNVESANIILTCAAHQKRIIDDVLILNRLETMLLSITPVKVQIPELLDHVSKIFQVELASEGMDLRVIQHRSYQEHNIDVVCCDPSRLTQIFINLISNAIKFTRARQEKRITLTYGASMIRPDEIEVAMTGEVLYWARTNKHHDDLTTGTEWGMGEPIFLRFAVQDTGPGLEGNEIQKLFNRFSQANAKTHITYGGSGLGLYISRELAEKQGGRIGIASTPDVGTVIAFYVKAKRAESDAPAEESSGDPVLRGYSSPRDEKRLRLTDSERSVRSEARATTNRVSHSNPSSMEASQINILLVEDNLINQKILRKQLQQAGYQVHVANHGLEALEVLEKSSAWISNSSTKDLAPIIDVILMDWEMPQMDGLTCSKRIRVLESEWKLSHIPIIAITANARSEQIDTAKSAGMDDVLTKPFLLPELTAKIRKWLHTGH